MVHLKRRADYRDSGGGNPDRMMDRWINAMKKGRAGKIITRKEIEDAMPELFLREKHRRIEQVIKLAVSRKAMTQVGGKMGEWTIYDSHQVLEIDEELARSREAVERMPYIPPVARQPKPAQPHREQPKPVVQPTKENASMQHAQKTSDVIGHKPTPAPPPVPVPASTAPRSATKEPMTEKGLKEKYGAKATDSLLAFLKGIFMFVGFEVMQYAQLRPMQHGYKSDNENDRAAFMQRFVGIRQMGIIVQCDREGNEDRSARGFGIFAEELVPIEWIREREERGKSAGLQKPKPPEVPTLLPKPADPPALSAPQALAALPAPARQVEPAKPAPAPATQSAPAVVRTESAVPGKSEPAKSVPPTPPAKPQASPDKPPPETQTEVERKLRQRIRQLEEENAQLKGKFAGSRSTMAKMLRAAAAALEEGD